MLLLGHAGVTVGTAIWLNSAFSAAKKKARGQQPYPGVTTKDQAPNNGIFYLDFFGFPVDIRLLLIASLLPDIIDKPVGQLFFRDIFSNGRIFSHTLLFPVLLSLIGLYLLQSRRKIWLIVLAFGSFMHLILDQMWLEPHTLFWPLYGFTFKQIDLAYWLQNEAVRNLATNPAVYISELVGATILICFMVARLRHRKPGVFLKKRHLLTSPEDTTYLS